MAGTPRRPTVQGHLGEGSVDAVHYTRLRESDEYAVARDELRRAELELTEHVERVAAQRRQLPAGPLVEDYALERTDGVEVRLSSLCSDPARPLIVYHLMYGKRQTDPCPMCTMWVDGFNGVATHVAQRANFAVVAAASPGDLAAHARSRRWDRLTVLSAGASSFKFDLGSEDADGNQEPRVSVFTSDGAGQVRHSYTGAPQLSGSFLERGIDLLCPTWQLFDLLPVGRGDWYASLSY
jgi:predicted dithiol-disulfide oxidoreductase (DUF899 family)